MTKMTRIGLPLTLAVCLAGAVAHAQSDPAQPAPATPTANAMNMTPSAAPATDPASATPPASTTGDAASAAPPMAAASGPAQVMSSPPVPDTAANRAKYGGPMSHAGKHSSAAGN